MISLRSKLFAAYRVWRRSRVYDPMMRMMFGVLRRFPADANRVVFEAGRGRQYAADSPRCIYEELVRRGSPCGRCGPTTVKSAG